MRRERHHPIRDRQGEAAAYAGAPVVERLEARRLMSAVPSVGPIKLLPSGPNGAATHAPLVVNGTPANAPIHLATTAGVAGAVPGSAGGGTPAGGNGPVAAKRSLWDRVKGAAKWVKNHVAIGLKHIGIKGTF